MKKSIIIATCFSCLTGACSPKDSTEQVPTTSKRVTAFHATEEEIDRIAAQRVQEHKVTNQSQCVSFVPKEVQSLPAYDKEAASVIVSYSSACTKHLARAKLQDRKENIQKPVSSPSK